MSEQFFLCWDNFHKNLSTGMHSLFEHEDLVDVTIAVDGKYLKAHKMILSICSPYFKELFQSNPCKHPIFFMRDVSYEIMNDLLTFMYQGEVQVSQDNLPTFIRTAESLQIKGLTNEESDSATETEMQGKQKPKGVMYHSLPKRQKLVGNGTIKMDQSLQSNSSQQEIVLKFEESPSKVSQAVEEYDDDETTTIHDDELLETRTDDATIDDPDDYTMLDADNDPKPGTSANIGTDSQVKSEIVKKPVNTERKKRPVPQKVLHSGFVYHLRLNHGKTRYFRCSKERYTGCTATAKLEDGVQPENIVMIRPHNHPPDDTIEIKTNFENQLKSAVETFLKKDVKSVYNSVAAIYPESAKMFPFCGNLYSKMNRWRRAFLESNG